MTRFSVALYLGAAFFALSLAGCGGIKSRISDNQRLFATYPPETQAQIQNGRIDHGFTEEMVYMAKGKPSEKSSIERDGRKIAVWKYARPRPPGPPGSHSGALSSPYGYPGFGPGPSQPVPMFYDRSYFKVEFENGKVVRWDQEMQAELPADVSEELKSAP